MKASKYQCFCWCNTIFKNVMHPSRPSHQTVSLHLLSASLAPCQKPFFFYQVLPVSCLPSPISSTRPPISSTHPPDLPSKDADLSAVEGTGHISLELGKWIQNWCNQWSWKLTPESWTRQNDTEGSGWGHSRRPLWLSLPSPDTGTEVQQRSHTRRDQRYVS